MIELGQALPAGWKFEEGGHRQKRLLKEKMDASISEQELAAEAQAGDPPLRTREELAYYRIFAERLGKVDPTDTIGRFATTA